MFTAFGFAIVGNGRDRSLRGAVGSQELFASPGKPPVFLSVYIIPSRLLRFVLTFRANEVRTSSDRLPSTPFSDQPTFRFRFLSSGFF